MLDGHLPTEVEVFEASGERTEAKYKNVRVTKLRDGSERTIGEMEYVIRLVM